MDTEIRWAVQNHITHPPAANHYITMKNAILAHFRESEEKSYCWRKANGLCSHDAIRNACFIQWPRQRYFASNVFGQASDYGSDATQGHRKQPHSVSSTINIRRTCHSCQHLHRNPQQRKPRFDYRGRQYTKLNRSSSCTG